MMWTLTTTTWAQRWPRSCGHDGVIPGWLEGLEQTPEPVGAAQETIFLPEKNFGSKIECDIAQLHA